MKQVFRFSLKQHIGEAAVPVVTKGDSVVRGQMLAAKREGRLGVPIHASVSGEVEKITEQEIVLLADDVQPQTYELLQGDDPLALIEEAGIVGLGGAGFPAYAKLLTPLPPQGIVIANAAECEPILTHNLSAILQDPGQLIRGLQIAMEIARAEQGIIAIKAIHEKAVARLQETLTDERVRIALLPDRYPMGEERALLRETLGILLGTDSLPWEAKAVVFNAETLCRMQEAVDLKKPLIEKHLTLAGKFRDNRNLIRILENVPIGISVGELFEEAGGLAKDYGELLMGGPFTGHRTMPEAPVLKTTGGLIATECFPAGPKSLGLLVCACGAGKERLEEIASSMGSDVAGVEYCKQAQPVKNGFKCENPGICPGQVQKVMALKKAGAQAILISNCSDCSNTVMSCAPKLGLPVYHCTDSALRAVNHKLIRRMQG